MAASLSERSATSACAIGVNSIVAVTLAHDGQNMLYCTGFEVVCGGATTGSIILAVLSGVLGGPLTDPIAVASGVLLSSGIQAVEFTNPLAAVNSNTDIVLTLAAAGAGNTVSSVVLHGFRGPGGRLLD